VRASIPATAAKTRRFALAVGLAGILLAISVATATASTVVAYVNGNFSGIYFGLSSGSNPRDWNNNQDNSFANHGTYCVNYVGYSQVCNSVSFYQTEGPASYAQARCDGALTTGTSITCATTKP
jgi:hypothetical protein